MSWKVTVTAEVRELPDEEKARELSEALTEVFVTILDLPGLPGRQTCWGQIREEGA